MIGAAPEGDTAAVLRRGVVLLAGLGIAGTTVELVFLRHWQTATQLIVWPALVALGIGLTWLVGRPSPTVVRRIRLLAALIVVVSVVGVALHIVENLGAGPLDRHFAAAWDTMSPVSQWWEAITGGVGPAPVLAPGALAEISLALMLATIRHPATLAEGTARAVVRQLPWGRTLPGRGS
jgi:hypothetical protein